MGRLVFTGYVATDNFMTTIVGRLNSDGALDTSFGDRGTIRMDFIDGQRGSMGSNVALTSDGKILVKGRQFEDAPVYEEIGLARLNSDGSLDTSFDGDGRASINQRDFGGGGILVTPDGKILLSGESDYEAEGQLVVPTATVIRLNADGSLDPSFGDGGIIAPPLGGSGSSFGAALLDPTGKILLPTFIRDSAGFSQTADVGAVVRLNSDGSFDDTFGVGGIVKVGSGASGTTSSIGQIVLQSDGKILADGVLNQIPTDDTTHQFTLFRFNADGSADADFGQDGALTTDIAAGTPATTSGISLNADGKLIVTGIAVFEDDPTTATDDGGARIVVARFDVGKEVSPVAPPGDIPTTPVIPPAPPGDQTSDISPIDTAIDPSVAPPQSDEVSLPAAPVSAVPAIPEPAHAINLLSDFNDDLLQQITPDIIAMS